MRSFMRLGLILIVVVACLSCSKPHREDKSPEGNDEAAPLHEHADAIDTSHFDYDEIYKLDSYLAKVSLGSNDVDTVNSDCAILIYPADHQIDDMKREQGDDFYTIADDFNWYQGMAIEMIVSLGVRKKTAEKGFLRLIGLRETWDLDVRKKNLPAWNLILFKTSKEPVIVSSVDLTTEQLRSYFDITK